jgi:multidrug efflux pump
VLTITLLTMAATVYLYVAVPKGFFPEQDTGRLTGAIQADQDISFPALRDKLVSFVDIVMKDPAVDTVAAFAGGGGGGNSARMFVSLKDLADRHVGADRVIARLRGQTARVPGATLFLQPVQDVRVGGRMSNALYQYTLQGDSVTELEAWSTRLFGALRRDPQLADVNTDQQNRGLQVSLQLDRETAARLGVTPQTMDEALYDAFGQRPVSTMYTQLNQYHVIMEAAPEFWQNPDGLRHIYVRSTTGAEIPLSAFTHWGMDNAPLAISHQGQFPSTTISFNLRPGVSLEQALGAIERTERDLRVPATIHGSFQGTAQAFQSSLASEPLLIMAALIAVYIVLGVLYESYIHPVTILSTLPSAGVGALLALLLTGTDLNLIALEAERHDGKGPEEAIYQACLLRFRPITMTTMAALLGALPLALGRGTGAELRRPLGIAIVGGLIFSQMLTLYTTPVVYLYLDRLRLRWTRPGRRTALGGVPGGQEA